MKQIPLTSRFASDTRGDGGHIWPPSRVSDDRSGAAILNERPTGFEDIHVVGSSPGRHSSPVNATCAASAGYQRVWRERVAFTIDEARAYLAEVRWRYAKTMPQWPHEYTVREWRPDLEREFSEFVALIRRDGIVKP